ncbi:MAG: serine/threonine protein kinase, partial [Planctomycetes bacterium]|nr:serine/threonine protein kinase [Planctomycetota bacterium]
MSERKEDDDYLGKGLSSVIRRQRQRDGAPGAASGTPLGPPPRLPDVDGEHPTELAGRPVVDLIGRGGVGLVYRVADRELGRELAVKILSRRYAGEPEMVQRFSAEARICAQLQHPGIVPIHEAGLLADGRPYFTMKVVEGDTLVDLLAARAEPFSSWRSFLEVFAKICQTMAFVHAQGVVHGDLKPSNVMVGAFGEVQVMDWGFARAIEPEAALRLPTAPGKEGAMHILGTPAYMAPEQARGDEAAITSRTDVFGLGAILCEILTGRPPYAGETRSATYLQATQCWQDDARAALQTCDADASLVDLAMRCLAPNPAERPMDAAAVGDEIAAYLEGAEQRAYQLELKAVAAEARADQVGRSRRVVVALGTALLAA